MPLPALVAAALPYVPAALSFVATGLSSYFKAKEREGQTAAAIETEQQRKKIAEENVHLILLI